MPTTATPDRFQTISAENAFVSQGMIATECTSAKEAVIQRFSDEYVSAMEIQAIGGASSTHWKICQGQPVLRGSLTEMVGMMIPGNPVYETQDGWKAIDPSKMAVKHPYIVMLDDIEIWAVKDEHDNVSLYTPVK